MMMKTWDSPDTFRQLDFCNAGQAFLKLTALLAVSVPGRDAGNRTALGVKDNAL
jgi:hypothetical protein